MKNHNKQQVHKKEENTQVLNLKKHTSVFVERNLKQKIRKNM